MAEKTTPPWAVEGAAVAIYNTGYSSDNVTLTTIARLTATQVICANGRRFYHTKFSRTGGLIQVGNQYGAVLLPAEDGRVREVLAQREYRKFYVEVEGVFKARPGSFDTMLAALDRITKLAAATRADIVQLAEGDQDRKEN